MEHFEILHTETRTVACDGGKGSLGHPRVFLNMGDATEVTCPYCSRHYVLQGDGKKAAAH
jgi:uncharacterized Zn-finger protein